MQRLTVKIAIKAPIKAPAKNEIALLMAFLLVILFPLPVSFSSSEFPAFVAANLRACIFGYEFFPAYDTGPLPVTVSHTSL